MASATKKMFTSELNHLPLWSTSYFAIYTYFFLFTYIHGFLDASMKINKTESVYKCFGLPESSLIVEENYFDIGTILKVPK